MDLWSGSLVLGGNGHFSGVVSTAAGSRIEVGEPHLTRGTLVLRDGARIDGQGSLAVHDGMTLLLDRSAQVVVAGSYTQEPWATVEFGLGGSQTCDRVGRLRVGGTATLAGSLVATLRDGCTPTTGQSFGIITATTLVGNFSRAELPQGLHAQTTQIGVILTAL